MSKEETPLQIDMFTGQGVDTRTRGQKQRDQQQMRPQQTELFSQRDIAQFGVNPHPLLPLSPHTKLVLISEDPRTPEEIERDRQRAAEALTYQLFPNGEGEPSPLTNGATPDDPPSGSLPRSTRTPPIIGFRKQARLNSVQLRRRT
jgi:hypothetical protein